MSEIIEATYSFLDALDKTDMIKKITIYRDKLMANKELLTKINSVQNEKDDNKVIAGRKVIYADDDYKMYMKYYNELSFLIMKINRKYKEYTNTSEHSCRR